MVIGFFAFGAAIASQLHLEVMQIAIYVLNTFYIQFLLKSLVNSIYAFIRNTITITRSQITFDLFYCCL